MTIRPSTQTGHYGGQTASRLPEGDLVTGDPRVAVCIVSHNSASDLPACLASVSAQDHRPVELVIVDCASSDGSLEAARSAADPSTPTRWIALQENAGFAVGMNEALSRTDAPYVLTLNPDARLTRDFIGRLLWRLEESSSLRVGAVTGRLLRLDADEAEPVLDACGMRLSPAWRHFDRASNERDRGQLAIPERVFGATGAASLFSRRALDDAALGGDVFAPEFHSYREDAELCFRLRERRWEILYEPTAIAYHRRANLPGRRRQMAAHVNLHSLKNRYLLRAYHQTLRNLLITAIPTLARDLMAVGYVLVREPSSFGAYSWIWENRKRIVARRRQIAARRQAKPADIDRWFFTNGQPL